MECFLLPLMIQPPVNQQLQREGVIFSYEKRELIGEELAIPPRANAKPEFTDPYSWIYFPVCG